MPESDYIIRPPRVTLTNLEDGDYITAQFNPAEVRERLSANFVDLAIMGLSHKPQQYTGTENLQLQFDLGLDAMSIDGGTDVLERCRRFLHSLCYSRRGSQDVVGGGVPRVAFTWPNLYDLTCTLRSVEIAMTRFNSEMQPLLAVATITVAEALDHRIYAEDVLQNGTIGR